MDDYYNLGGYSRAITAAHPDASLWFNRGLVWCYGFHHEEALRCFANGLVADPDSCMNHWGIAYASGPNYNKDWDAFGEGEMEAALADIRAELAEAQRCAPAGTALEADLVGALVARYPADGAEQAAGHDRYAAAMRDVYARHTGDPDVAALFAEALMNRTPWALWDLGSGAPADGADTEEARRVLETAMANEDGMAHPGLLHFYIHLMEMSPTPEAALPAADALRNLVPDAGHLRHMPTHIDVLCGHYERVVTSNQAAIDADGLALARDGALNFYSLYRCHNYHFKLYGAMFLGDSARALEAGDEMAALLTPELLSVEDPPMADWLEGFVPMRLHVLIRFGLWEQILTTPFPADRDLYCTTTAMLHYARTVAWAVSDRVTEAAAEAALFDTARARVPGTRYVFNNTCQDILAIAEAMLRGELEYRMGNVEEGFAHLRRAVKLDDALPYDEPWGWMQPTRHALGALLLEQDRVEEAFAVYAADLGFDAILARPCQHPDNVWSLAGIVECLERLGRVDEAQMLGQRLAIARARADVPVEVSCLCRRSAAERSRATTG